MFKVLVSYIKKKKPREGTILKICQDSIGFNKTHIQNINIFTAPGSDSLYEKSYKLSTNNRAWFLHRLLIHVT